MAAASPTRPPTSPLSDNTKKVIAAYRLQFTVPADRKDLRLEVFHKDLSTHTDLCTPQPMEAGTFSSPPRWGSTALASYPLGTWPRTI
jgi:hypothetical protein